ncbi:hypothetical protein RRF57_007419 [Xylaria bambusicola]|uniref:Acid ceramidase N-terminal domain-containing protein n=1 Tax=Xylaria bambusicola TaxID=326684 RepID=A0AAN7UG48_9PEZI
MPATCGESVPRFTIDLAKPPSERYHEMVQVFGSHMRSLAGVLDGVLSTFIASTRPRPIAKGLSKICLRRVYDKE